MSNEIVLTHECIDSIPLVSCYTNDQKRKPLVILLHGFKGNKEGWLPRLKQLAGNGYFAVAIDNPGHGERKGKNFESIVMKDGKWDVYEIRVLINKTAEDVSTVITHLLKNKIIDQSNIAVVGVSMGGFASYKAMTGDNRISTICPMIASPYWDDIPEGVPALIDEESITRLQEYSDRNCPGAYPEKFNKRPMLVQVGGNDKHSNVNRVITFCKTMAQKYYKDTEESVKLISYKGVSHEFTESMWDEVCIWIEKYLHREPKASREASN